jgi:signal transduction histidine kinase
VLTYLTNDARIPRDQRGHLRTINESGEHLLTLINEILDITKIETGRSSLTAQNFDLWELLDGIEQLIRVRTRQKGLELRVMVDRRVPRHVHGDAQKLRQVLLNLLGNAVKYTEVGHAPLDVTCVEQAGSCNRICFVVSDSGIGIAHAEQARIFEPRTSRGARQGPRAVGVGAGPASRPSARSRGSSG